MLQIGKYNSLEVIKMVDFGVYVDGGEEYGEILVPKRYVEQPLAPGDKISVFVYMDSEDRLVGTTEVPLATVGDIACLEVVGLNQTGAFLNWGLMKDLLLPFSEQKGRVSVGDRLVVMVYQDPKSERPVATQKIGRYLSDEFPNYKQFSEVQILVESKTDLGYRCIVDGKYFGLVYDNMLIKPISIGDRITAYVDRVRTDGKIDLILERPGIQKVETVADRILNYLKENNGEMPYHDKSDPEIIREVFQTSKKTFKRSLGDLYKQKKIIIGNDGVKLLE